MADTKRKLLGCPSSVTLNPNDWRELRTSQWRLQAVLNIHDVACDEDSIFVVMGHDSGIYVDVISVDGRNIAQARANVSHHTDLYTMQEARMSKSGWRARLVAYWPGPSINVPTVPIATFEIALEPTKPN